jgi:hypothetical protein
MAAHRPWLLVLCLIDISVVESQKVMFMSCLYQPTTGSFERALRVEGREVTEHVRHRRGKRGACRTRLRCSTSARILTGCLAEI